MKEEQKSSEITLKELVNMLIQKECVINVSMGGTRYITIPETLLRSNEQKGPAA